MVKNYKIFFHIDLNAFFAECEVVNNPKLKGKPIGIAGRKSDRGVLTTANYIAREFGVTSAMPVVKAKSLCKDLIIVPVHFDLYSNYSKMFFDILFTYTDQIEPASIDEAYLDVTNITDDIHPIELAKKMQQHIKKELGLGTSIGIAPNMFLAKMASDMKKPMGITVLRKRDIVEKLWPLPIEKMHGIGKKTYPKLKTINIKTIGDFATCKEEHKLHIILGNKYQEFLNKANGIDSRLINVNRFNELQSIGNSTTFDSDLVLYSDCYYELSKLLRRVINRMQDRSLVAKTFSVQIKYFDFKTVSKSITLDNYTDEYYKIYQIVESLFDEIYNEKPVRLLGVSSTNLKEQSEVVTQLNLFTVNQNETKQEGVIRLLNNLKNQYGDNVIQKGIKIKAINTEKYKK